MSANQLAILGAGSWGTALAIALSQRFERVYLWAHSAERATAIDSARENVRSLPGFALPPAISLTSDLQTAVSGCSFAISAVPSRHVRAVISQIRPHVAPGTSLVSATKGIEEGTLLRMSEVMRDALGSNTAGGIAVLSGPTFAREVAAAEPAAVVIASEDLAVAESVQRAFATPTLRFYASTDVIGVEFGAALKNVIAIGAGLCSGLGLGSNSVAALVTRGLAEITRLAVNMGGHSRTLAGLTGLGDLVLTATGDLSRNRFVGKELGQGRKLPDILAGMTMVAEGVETCRAARELGLQRGVEMPIIQEMYRVLYEEKSPREAIRDLMERPLTIE